jgi:uncharacterized protein (TIRG00374 family)
MGKRLFSAVSIVLGIAGFCAVPWLVGMRDVLWTVGRVGWWGVLLCVVNASGTLLLPAIGWWLLMRAEGIPVALRTTITANLMGFPLDFVVPSAYLGGEPLKTIYIARVCQVTTPRVLATILVAKYQELGGLVLWMLVATALVVWRTDAATTPQAALLLAVLVILVGLLGLTLYAFAGRCTPLVTLLTCLARWHIFPTKMAQLQAFAAEVEQLIAMVLTERVAVVLLAQLMAWLSTVSLFIRPWLFFWFLPGARLSVEQLCALFVLTNLVNLLTVVPGGLGWFEATMAGYARATGLGDEKGVAFALVSRIADLTLLTLGCWLIVHAGLSYLVRGQAGERQSSAERIQTPGKASEKQAEG